jgi:hypothetical protein
MSDETYACMKTLEPPASNIWSANQFVLAADSPVLGQQSCPFISPMIVSTSDWEHELGSRY